MTIIAVLFVAVFTSALLWAEVAASPSLRWFKMLASTGFIAVALSAGALSSSYGKVVLVALGLSWIGDLLLTFSSRQAFLGGLVAFLLGHVAYSVAFGSLGVNPVVGVIAAVVIAGIAIFVWRWLAPHVGDMTAPVIAYVVVISVMVVLAFGTFGNGATWLIPVGATLFFASDLFVARNQFVAPGIVNRVWGLPLYFLAQVLLALSVTV
ncbi:MAG: lysoplasmalogenase [Actinomycetota bacterium]|nr:lysoplasmalogenase [Actinomycetota bacterium]